MSLFNHYCMRFTPSLQVNNILIVRIQSGLLFTQLLEVIILQGRESFKKDFIYAEI